MNCNLEKLQTKSFKSKEGENVSKSSIIIIIIDEIVLWKESQRIIILIDGIK